VIVLLDANVLIALVIEDHVQHPAYGQATATLHRDVAELISG
jgi:predicted nucleic acid-binding protein